MSTTTIIRHRIGLLGPYSFGNMGNAALQQVLFDRLLKQFPEAEFYGCCIDPEERLDTRRIFPFPFNRRVFSAISNNGLTETAKLSSTTNGRKLSTLRGIPEEIAFWRQAYRWLKQYRLLVLGLGGLFDEQWGGKWGDLYVYFCWAVLARLVGTPIICLGIGIEEVHSAIGKFFCRLVLRTAKYRSFRDVESRRKAECMGVRLNDPVFPDTAFGLKANSFRQRENRTRPRPRPRPRPPQTVGVSPIPYCDPRFWHVKNRTAYQGYLEKLGSFVSWLLASGYQVILFPTQICMDDCAMDDLRNISLRQSASKIHGRLTTAKPRSVDDCLALMGRLDVVITSRLHGAILSFLSGSPVLAISPASKVHCLMDDMGLRSYVLDIDDFDLTSLIAAFENLLSEYDSVQGKILTRVTQYRRAVDAQFEALFRKDGILSATP